MNARGLGGFGIRLYSCSLRVHSWIICIFVFDCIDSSGNSTGWPMLRTSALLVVILTLAASHSFAENWPAFRGPTGLGYTREKGLPISWGGDENKNILWKSPLPGDGLASPIVWNDNVFVCTVRWPGDGSPQETVMPVHHVTCYTV